MFWVSNAVCRNKKHIFYNTKYISVQNKKKTKAGIECEAGLGKAVTCLTWQGWVFWNKSKTIEKGGQGYRDSSLRI